MGRTSRHAPYLTVNGPAKPYPPIGDYAFIGDCHSGALVSRSGSVDWCCMPRLDAASTFGRLLDWANGGMCAVSVYDSESGAPADVSRSYIDDTMVLETVFRTNSGEARLIDCFTIRPGGREEPHRQLLRVIEGRRGEVRVAVSVVARFDYGSVKPWVRRHSDRVWSAVGGDDAIAVAGDLAFELKDRHDLHAPVLVTEGQRLRLSIVACRPEQLDPEPPAQPDGAELDHRLDTTIAWWRKWIRSARMDGIDSAETRRSALVLKALTNAPTGAIAAAPTTSLPEDAGGERNWDYRFSWIRDSAFTLRSLGELGFDREVDGYRRFVERTAAGAPEDLQIMYGLGGRRRLTELVLPLEGYRRSSPVRIGNAAAEQLQLDVYGELLDIAWQWHRRGHSPDDDYWRFLASLIDTAAARWSEPDRGIWEIRGEPRHFVHSKAMCWAAIDRGIRLAEECGRRAPLTRWRKTRKEIRESVEAHGVDGRRGCYVQHYGSTELDASLLLIPATGFAPYDDPRVVATVDAVAHDLDEGGFIRRYCNDDGLEGKEGVFVACTFWLAECLASTGRGAEARAAYDRARTAANDLGLYAEEFDPASGQALGNFPQGLSHLSEIAAAVAIARPEGWRDRM